jgi:hypothetical protein
MQVVDHNGVGLNILWVGLIPDDGGSTHLWNVGRQSFYTAVYPRRQLWTLCIVTYYKIYTWPFKIWTHFTRAVKLEMLFLYLNITQ